MKVIIVYGWSDRDTKDREHVVVLPVPTAPNWTSVTTVVYREFASIHPRAVIKDVRVQTFQHA